MPPSDPAELDNPLRLPSPLKPLSGEVVYTWLERALPGACKGASDVLKFGERTVAFIGLIAAVAFTVALIGERTAPVVTKVPVLTVWVLIGEIVEVDTLLDTLLTGV